MFKIPGVFLPIRISLILQGILNEFHRFWKKNGTVSDKNVKVKLQTGSHQRAVAVAVAAWLPFTSIHSSEPSSAVTGLAVSD